MKARKVQAKNHEAKNHKPAQCAVEILEPEPVISPARSHTLTDAEARKWTAAIIAKDRPYYAALRQTSALADKVSAERRAKGSKA